MTNPLNTLAIGQSINPVGDQKNTLETDINTIINVIIGVLGVVAVAVIILGGVSYMTSSGDAGKVKKAKDTILYGVIGLIVVALAFAIVNFVIGGVLGNNKTPTCDAGFKWNSTTQQCEAIDPLTNGGNGGGGDK